MEILLIVPRYNFTIQKNYDYKFPLGLAYISSVLKKSGYKVNCLNLNHLEGKISSLIEHELDQKKYDVVCTGGNALVYPVIKLITEIVAQHKTNPLIILGGPLITSEPALMIESLKSDFGVISEGEETITELLKTIKQGDLSKVAGIVYKDKTGKIIITAPRPPIKDIEGIPWPDFEGLNFSEKLDYEFANGVDYPRTYFILGSRGCPFNCTFCWHDQKYRARSMEDIMKELRFNVKKYKINNINLLDDCFSINTQRVYDFCQGIKDLSKEVGWPIHWFCSLMVTSVTKELLDIMKDAGCVGIGYGFESYSPIVLKSMGKPITPQQIAYAINQTMDAKIAVIGGFILGDIAETKETARETINYWKNNCKHQLGLSFITPYPGSKLYQHCIQRGIIKDKIGFINDIGSKNVTKMTENFTDKEFNDLIKEVLGLVGKGYYFSKIVKMKKMNDQSYELKIRCPFCKELIIYKNFQAQKKWLFRSNINCKNCGMASMVASPLQKLAYKNYALSRSIRSKLLMLKGRFIIKILK